MPCPVWLEPSLTHTLPGIEPPSNAWQGLEGAVQEILLLVSLAPRGGGGDILVSHLLSEAFLAEEMNWLNPHNTQRP